MQHQGAKREMGRTDFKWGGRAPLAPPLATALTRNYEKRKDSMKKKRKDLAVLAKTPRLNRFF